MEITKTSLRGFRILTLVTLIVCCAAIVCSVTALGTMGQVYGVAPGIGDVVTYLLQIHAFTAFFLGWMCLALLFAHARRAFFVKLTGWAILVLMLLHIAPFFTDTVFYMSTVSFSAGLNYFSAYVPALMTAIVFGCLLSIRTPQGRHTANRVSLVCGLVAIFMCIVYLAQVFPLMALTTTLHDNSQLWGLVFGNSAITLAAVLVWAMTFTERRYERVMYDLTDEEAFVREIVEERTISDRERIRQEVEAELAEDAAQEAAFDALGGEAGAVSAALDDVMPPAPEVKETNPLLARWEGTDKEEEHYEKDPLDELWRPEPVEEIEEETEDIVEEEPPARRGRFIPAKENQPGLRNQDDSRRRK